MNDKIGMTVATDVETVDAEKHDTFMFEGFLDAKEERVQYEAILEIRNTLREIKAFAEGGGVEEMAKKLPAPIRMMLGLG